MKAQKQVKIIATYYHKTDGKLNGRVTYLVRASNGKDTYCTTLVEGKASGCSCPSTRKCYHMTQLEELQWARYRAEVAKKLVAKDMTVEAVEQMAETLMSEPVVSKPDQQVSSPKIVDIGSRGTLNGNSGFQLMRVG